ncbi:hypothetical protein Tco_0648857 [Tanacetum coccineum]
MRVNHTLMMHQTMNTSTLVSAAEIHDLKRKGRLIRNIYLWKFPKGPQNPETSVSDDQFSENSVTSNEEVVSTPKPKEAEPSCVTHVKTPRQPMKSQGTPKVNGKNWNERMERDLGEGYSFIKKKCFVCGSLSYLIRDYDFYEKKMAREAELKKQRVFNTGNRVAKPVWNNANRVNHANQFVPRPVQLNAVRPNVNSVRSNVNTGRANVNSVRTNVNSVRSNVNTGRANVNSVRQKVNTGSFNVNTVRTKQPVPTSNSKSFSPVRPQVNKGNWGTAVKTSAGYNWRNTRPNSSYNSGSNFVQIVNAKGPQGRPKPEKAWDDFEECKGGSVTFGGSKGYITGKGVKQKTDGIFISQDKYVADMLKKFDLASVKPAITPIETKMALTKDEEADDVDVTPKTSHLNAMKRIFKYLKGKPNLGLWYPRESSFDLEAFSDSDYVGANLDSKSITVKQFCQTATTTTIVDGTLELRATIDTRVYTITEASVRSKLQLADASGISMLPNTEIFDGMGNIGYLADDQSAGPADQAEDQPSSTEPLPSSSHPPIISATIVSEPTPVAEPTTHPTSPSPKPANEPTDHTFEQPSPENQPLSPRQEPEVPKSQDPTHTHMSEAETLTVEGLLHLVPNLITKVDSLETELKQTKQTMGKAIVKLVKKVKKMENILKRRHVVLTELEDEEPEDQGRIFKDIDDDPLVSFVTPTKPLGETQKEEISPTTLEASKTLSKVASQRSKSVDKGKRYKRRKESKGKDFEEVNTGSRPVSSGFEEVNTGGLEVNICSGPVSSDRGQREGKALMIVEETQAPKRTKEQIQQEESSLAEAIRLQTVRSRGSDFDIPVVFSLIIALLRNKFEIRANICSLAMEGRMDAS